MFISGPTDESTNSRLKRFDQLKTYFERQGHRIITELDVPMPELEKDVESLIDSCDKESALVSWMIISMSKIWIMATCDALFLLSDWQECHTSIILFVIARKLGMPVYVDTGSAIKLANEKEVRDWFNLQMDEF